MSGQRHPSREPFDAIDVEGVARNDRAYHGELFRRDRPAEHGDDEAVFPLTGNPVIEIGFGDWGKPDLQSEFGAPCAESVLQRCEAFAAGRLDQQAESQGFVDHGLADVEHTNVVVGEDCGQRCSQPRRVLSGEMNQDRFFHER